MIRFPAVWFPAIRVGTGADVFTQRLCSGLTARNIRAEITWLPRRSEYLPWTVAPPDPPAWANIVHVNTWLHKRFVPRHLALVATMHHNVHDPLLSPYKTHTQSLYHRCWVRPLESWILHHADAITTVSEYSARKARDTFGVQTARVIYNGMSIPDESQLQSKLAPHEPFKLLYVGSWSRRKGVDLLGPIMERLGKNFELSYTADTHIKPTLPGNCRSLGRPNAQHLQQTYREADALLFPTRLEGFGQVALEAMAYGVPVIATNGSALPEVVQDGLTGILCPQDDCSAFAAAAQRLMDDRELWASMSKAAIRHARRRLFSTEAMVESYISVYEALSSQPRTSS